MATLVADVLSGTTDTLISGTVYEDLNSNGVREGGEDGIPGWTVYLDLDHSGTLNTDAAGTLEPSTLTNKDGDYAINRLIPGTYRLSEVMQPGWSPTAPISQDVVVTNHKTTKADFFNFSGGDIIGTVWNDLDQDGIRATDPDSGAFIEPGLAGWTVFLDLDTDMLPSAGEPLATTGADGSYAFVGLPPGDYEVTEVLPAGWEVTEGFDIHQTAGVVARQHVVQDFANFSLTNGSIQGVIWNDTNANGLRETDPDTGEFTEPGLADWTVFLDTNNNRVLDPSEVSTVTDANGNYLFLSLNADDYEVVEVLPDGWDVSPTFDSKQTVAVAGGEVSQAEDFANFTVLNGSIRGSVWNDINHNGLRDVSTLTGAYLEPGLANWMIFIDMNRNGLADPMEPVSLTDSSGDYTFLDLQVGEYEIVEVLPTGWEVAPTYDENQSVIVYSGTETIAADFANYNVAVATPGSLSGVVWKDLDADGVRDVDSASGEFIDPGLAGWTVFVDVNADRILSLGEPQATTATDGSYSLADVLPGTVTIRVQPTEGWRATSPLSNSRTLALRSGDAMSGLDFGEAELKDASIRGTVFADANHDHARSAGEKGLGGITVYLDLNNNAALDVDEPQVQSSSDLYYTPGIDEAGAYSFTHLASGTYTVRQMVPATLSATPLEERERILTISAFVDLAGVDFADVYRANEIHGVKFEDANENHVRDEGERGVAGATIYIDLDRDNMQDAEEPSTVTLADGSYSFTNLAPGAYVVREVTSPGYTQTSPTTLGGVLWPEGISNPASGAVNPTSITTSLAIDEHYRQTVSLTLPNTGALTNLVDVFLLFDDTGSFVDNSPIVRAAFPDIIAHLQASLPGIDLGFGVGRLEEYADFAWEYASGRPFILNQPIVAASSAGYLAAIQAALDRETPGYGGDEPETDIEALFQVVTGRGFDGNNNGSVLDSGPAGLAATQLNPGSSGDVPSFSSFVADPANNVMPAAGNVGGAGFRAGALPIILLATDTGFAFQPQGESVITGLGGVTVPVSSLTQTSRPTTPFNYGAGLQETITGLNALGALVIGLGTNTEANFDPRQGLEVISQLTGATNQSAATIDNGTSDPIAPGDPLYFQIASGFGASVANGVTSAIQNAVTNVAVDIDVRASDPRVQIINHTGILRSIGAGATATFDVEVVGDGIPHRFDLQFVRAGTNVVLGSIPVVIGTPIPGNCYEFDDLEEGEIELEDNFGGLVSSVAVPNVAPAFVAGGPVNVAEDAGPQSIAVWATAITPGPASEASQLVKFVVSNDQEALFSSPPAIAADGTLTFTSAANAYGTATVSVQLHDNGGVANGGVDTSATQTFVITVNPVNDAPVAASESYATDEDTTLTIPASGVLSNDTDVENSPLTAILVSGPTHGTLTLNADGSLTYVPATNYNGKDSFTYKANDGAADSNVVTVSLAVTAVNDPPVAVGDSYTTAEDTTLTIVASGVLGNDTDIDSVPLNAILVGGPTHGTLTLNSDGSFTYVSAANYNGSDSFTYKANDTAADSNVVKVSLTITPVNDAPVATNDAYSTNQDTNLVVPSATGVLLNDPDVDGNSLTAQLITGPSHGSLTLGTDGSFTYIPNAGYVGLDSFVYLTSDGSLPSNNATVTIDVRPVTPPTGAKFLVVDRSAHDTFEYSAAGQLVDNHNLNVLNESPRGIAANADGSLRWVIDASGAVFVYDQAGKLTGAWFARGLSEPEGITTNGRDVWIVDHDKDRVFFYANGAARRFGFAAPSSSFALHGKNQEAMDIATDGTHLWVVDDASTDRVFRYAIGGKLEGSWKIDPKNSHPTGLTIDPQNVSNIWIVDVGTDRVYQYDAAVSRLSGSQLASTNFVLAAANRNPQGIADPPPVASLSAGVVGHQVRTSGTVLTREVSEPAHTSSHEAESASKKSRTIPMTEHSPQKSAADRNKRNEQPATTAKSSAQAHDEALTGLLSEYQDLTLADSLDSLSKRGSHKR